MIISDQPGRFLAVFVFAPFIIYKGNIYKDNYLIMFGILLFCWDLYWIINHPPKKIDIIQ